jgi:hypothetical protein
MSNGFFVVVVVVVVVVLVFFLRKGLAGLEFEILLPQLP